MASKTSKKSAKVGRRGDKVAATSGIFSPSTTAAVVRYQVQDVDRAVAFYTQHLGFQVTQRTGPVAIVSRGDLHLLFSGPASSGSRPMPNGRRQEPGGWNRIVLYVDSIDSTIAALTEAGAPSGTRSRSGRVASRSWSRIPMAIPSNSTRDRGSKARSSVVRRRGCSPAVPDVRVQEANGISMATLNDLIYVALFAVVGPLIDYSVFWLAYRRPVTSRSGLGAEVALGVGHR